MEGKTVLQWFEQAKTDGYEWADNAIDNCQAKLCCGCKDDTCNSLVEALEYGFTWHLTSQGKKYWLDALDTLINKTK